MMILGPVQWLGAADRPYARQLARECDALIQARVQRPYGCGWDAVAPASPGGRNTPRHVSMEPLGTPTAGLLLLWSGQLLNEPRYKQAAMEAARGIAAAQAGNGKIPQRAIFGSAAGGRDAPSLVPERAGTRASLTLLLALLADDPSGSERLAGPAQRAATWLMKQQADDGGWIVAYPPDAAPRDATRLLRLDGSEYRDCTYTLLVAADTIKDAALTHASAKSTEKLLGLRLASRIELPRDATANRIAIAAQAVHLWSSAYRPNGDIDDKLVDFPMAADIVASKYAIQTLMGVYLMTGDRSAAAAIEPAARAIAELRGNSPIWRRGYITGPTSAPSTQPLGMFDVQTPPTGIWETGTFGIEPTLEAAAQLKLLGREKYLGMLSVQQTVAEQLSATVCGLTDDPLILDLPVTRDEVPPYLQKTAARWEELTGPMPDDLPSRLHRLWRLWTRAKLEALADAE